MVSSAWRVLVVDDDTSIRESLRMALEDAGYRVTEAVDGVAALAALRASPDPLVVLTDLMMPGMDGLQLLQVVMADATLASRHSYIVLSAVAVTPQVAETLTQLCVPFLRKPFDIDRLLAVVADAAAWLG